MSSLLARERPSVLSEYLPLGCTYASRVGRGTRALAPCSVEPAFLPLGELRIFSRPCVAGFDERLGRATAPCTGVQHTIWPL